MCQKDIIAVLAIAGLFAIAQQPARLTNLAFSHVVFNLNLSHQNAVSHQQQLGGLRLAVTARTVRSLARLSPFRSGWSHVAAARRRNSAPSGLVPL